MSEKQPVSFEALVSNPNEDVDFVLVETKRGMLKIAVATSEGMLDWLAENESEDKEQRRFKGLRLVTRCIVNPDGQRIAKDDLPAAVAALKARSMKENGPLIDAAFAINGVTLSKPKGETKNEPGEAPTASGGSPTDSPSN
jgi:hypothetical protein